MNVQIKNYFQHSKNIQSGKLTLKDARKGR